MGKVVEFYFDVGSPASYLAWTQLPKICADAGAELVYRPMLLGGVFQATGNASPASIPVKGRYTGIDNLRFARRYGVPLKMNPYFPIITLYLMRAVTGVQMRDPGLLQTFLAMAFKAIWIDARNLNEPEQTAAAITSAGFDPAYIDRLTNDPAVKTALRATTEDAVTRGVFGAPTCFVGDEMFFGQDRLDFIREAIS